MKSLKYTGLALCGMMMMAGCSEEELVKNGGQQGNYTVTVSRVQESRTWLPENPVDNQYPTYWNEDDKIEVASGDRKVRGVLSLYEGKDETNAKFSGLLNGAQSKLEYAVFPLPNSKGEVELTSRSYKSPNAPMIGTFGTDKTQVNFENTCGMFRLVINNYPADKDLIVKGEGISGTAKPVKVGDKWDLQWTPDTKNQVTITETPSEPGTVVFYVPVITDQILVDKDLNSIKPTEITVAVADTEASITKALKIAKRVVSSTESSTFLTLTYLPEEDGREAQLIEAWDGDADTAWYTENPDATEFTISTASELAGLAKLVNEQKVDFEGKTIKLAKSINLDDKAWTPIGKYSWYSEARRYFNGTFDGQGNTISNLYANGENAGLFECVWGATIKNLTIENATVEGEKAGVIAAYVYGNANQGKATTTIEDVTVTGTTVNGQENEPLFGVITSYAAVNVVENGETTPYTSNSELAARLAKGGTVTLDEDFVCSSIEPLLIPEGVEVILDLNGKTITGSNSDAIIVNNGILKLIGNGTIKNQKENGGATIKNNGDLVLDGVTVVGAPIGDTGYPAYCITSSGDMTIEKGTSISADRGCLSLSGTGETIINGGIFTNNDIGEKSLTGHVVLVGYGANNKLTINDGTFQHLHTKTSGGVVINNWSAVTVDVNDGNFSGGNYFGKWDNLSDYGYGSTETPFAVKGGTFTGFDDNYLAEGYKSTDMGNGTWIVTKADITPVINPSGVQAAIAAGSNNVTLVEDMKLDSGILAKAEDLTINLEANTTVTVASGAMSGSNTSVKNFTFEGDKSTTVKLVNENPGYEGPLAYHDNANLTFKGITFNADDISGICARGGEVTFENCTIEGELEKTIASKFVFSGCTFDAGVTQAGYGCSDVTFENGCKFETDGYGIKIYSEGSTPVNLTVNDCYFENTGNSAKSAIFLDHIVDGITYNITVDGCTFEGYTATPIPEENPWAARMIVTDSFVKTADGQYIFSYQTGAEGGNYHKILTDQNLVVDVK